MSKKFIALVLFAAMLVSIVPVANAQTNYSDVAPSVEYYNTGWYAGQKVQDLDAATLVVDKEYKGLGAVTLGDGTTTDGIAVKIGATKTNTDGSTKRTITLDGSFSELQPFYYTHLAQNGAMGIAVKIPVQITAKGQDVSQSAYISGVNGYLNTYGANQQAAYITVILTPDDQDFVFNVWYANSKVHTVTVEWDNDDNDVTAAKSTAVPTLTVVGVAGAQKENFRADFTQAAWKYESNQWRYYPGTLQFNIAAMTANDRAAIMTVNDNRMTVKVKALDKNGYPYPQGTIVAFMGATNQNLYLGSSDKFVTVNAEASYLVDNMGCFNLTFDGIRQFAAYAATGDNANFKAIAGGTYADKDAWKAIDQYDNVYLYTLVSNGLTTNTLQNQLNSKYFVDEVKGAFTVRFAYGNTMETLGFNLKYQNVARSKSGITLLTDVITVKVGEQTGIPYIIDDPMAMYQGVKGDWTYVNEKIAKAGTDTNGDEDTAVVKGVKVGTTYAYVEDQDGDIELVVINVVPADYVEAPVVEPEVEVGTKYVVTASKLNVREGAGTSYSKIRQIDRNTVVTGTEVEGSVWVKLNDGGYVHGKYLAEVE